MAWMLLSHSELLYHLSGGYFSAVALFLHRLIIIVFLGCFPSTNMQTPLPIPSGVPSSEIRIKDAQCPKKNDERKISYHIISHLGAAGVHKGRFGRPIIQLSSKVAKFAG